MPQSLYFSDEQQQNILFWISRLLCFLCGWNGLRASLTITKHEHSCGTHQSFSRAKFCYTEILHLNLMFPMQHVMRCYNMGKVLFNLYSQSLTKEKWCHLVLWIQVFFQTSLSPCVFVHVRMHSSHDYWIPDHLPQNLHSTSLMNIAELAGLGKWGNLIYSLEKAGSIRGFFISLSLHRNTIERVLHLQHVHCIQKCFSGVPW